MANLICIGLIALALAAPAQAQSQPPSFNSAPKDDDLPAALLLMKKHYSDEQRREFELLWLDNMRRQQEMLRDCLNLQERREPVMRSVCR
jgi:hypothetical protein